jgi:cytochrome c-type protein NapB
MNYKRYLLPLLSLSVLVVSGCAIGGLQSEESLGLRKTNLYAEATDTVGERTDYSRPAPGESKVFDRAFENAPPMISHNVDGMLPVTAGNNSCLGCHLPTVAKSVGATAIPGSHFASFRPTTSIGANGEVIKEGKAIDNNTDIVTVTHKQDDLNMGRYNCTLCHAPQSKNDPLVENTFQAEFRTKDGATASNFIDVLNEGVQ